MRKDWKVYTAFIVITELVGIISGLISRGDIVTYGDMNSSIPLAPPAILFPIVWTILYAFMGISVARVWLAEISKERTKALKIYILQLVVNFFWSIIFFNFEAYGFAFVWLILLWILIVLMIRSFAKVDMVAAKLQIPYLVWVTFAAYLNLAVWIKNF